MARISCHTRFHCSMSAFACVSEKEDCAVGAGGAKERTAGDRRCALTVMHYRGNVQTWVSLSPN